MDQEKKVYGKFAEVRLLGARALQLSQGAPPLIDIPLGVKRPLDIAKLELKAGVIPIEVRRKIGYFETKGNKDWE